MKITTSNKDVLRHYLDKGYSKLQSTIIANRVSNINFMPCPTLEDITPIEQLYGVDKGSELLASTIINKDPILINTDLDCDGITSASIFYLALTKTFNYPKELLTVFTNERRYKRGINNEVMEIVDRVIPTLFVTADHGSSDNNYCKLLKDRGISTIITDHHIFTEYPTEADVFINPQQERCRYDKTISGGVVLYLLLLQTHKVLLERDYNCTGNLGWLLPIVAFSTLGDRMDMSTTTNRALVRHGLKEVNSNPIWDNFKRLYGKGKKITQQIVDFEIVPSINSAGRMGNSRLGFEMLINITEDTLYDYVKRLKESNLDRKRLQREIAGYATAQYLKRESIMEYGIVVAVDGINGVNGVVAGNLVERFNKPTIVFGIDEYGILRGSGRSIEGVNILGILDRVKEIDNSLILHYGGHKGALGVTIEGVMYDRFVTIFNRVIKELGITIGDTDRYVDMVGSDFLNLDSVKEIRELEPYGIGFNKPIFGSVGMVSNCWYIGKDKEHMKLSVKIDGREYEGIWFNCGRVDVLRKSVEVIYELDENSYRGDTMLTLLVRHMDIIESS